MKTNTRTLGDFIHQTNQGAVPLVGEMFTPVKATYLTLCGVSDVLRHPDVRDLQQITEDQIVNERLFCLSVTLITDRIWDTNYSKLIQQIQNQQNETFRPSRAA